MTTVITQWKDDFFVKSYQLARAGLANREIAKTFGVKPGTFGKWISRKPALSSALKEGRNKGKGMEDSYIFGRLSERAQAVWRRVLKAEKEKNGVRKVEMLFDKYGDGVRKELFLHCLAGSYFNPSQACRRVGVPYRQFKKWCEDDYEFLGLVEEMNEHKGNFYDEHFNKLVEQDEPSVVIHAQKTFNAKKGFSEKLEVKHSGEIKNSHVIELGPELLDRLSRTSRLEIMEAMKEMEAEGEEKKLITVDAE